MKRSFFFSFILLLLIGLLYGQNIRIVDPNGGEVWADGTTQRITWIDEGISGNIVIELIRFFGNRPSYSSAKVLYSGDINNNNNSFIWVISEKLKMKPGVDHTYRIRISSVNNSAIRDMSDRNFKITPKKVIIQPGSIKITYPNAETVWNMYPITINNNKFNYTITWRKSGRFHSNSSLRIILCGVSGAARKFSALLTQGTPNDGHFSGNILIRYPVGRYQIKMKVVGQSRYIAESALFKIEKKRPVSF